MKADLKIEFKRVPQKYGSDYINCLVGEGVVVGYVHQPTQTKDYAGPRHRADTTLPGIKIKDGLLHETRELAEEQLRRVVTAWFQRCGIIAEAQWPNVCHESHKSVRASDASSFDMICDDCGATDQVIGGWGDLRKPCTASAISTPAAAHTVVNDQGLTEALTKLLERYLELVNCGDCGSWDPEQEPAVIRAREALGNKRPPAAPDDAARPL